MPFLFGLAPDGVYLARLVALAAVRSYRTFSPLPVKAVCFLWHFPSMSSKTQRLGVTQHPALMEPGLSSHISERDYPDPLTRGLKPNNAIHVKTLISVIKTSRQVAAL